LGILALLWRRWRLAPRPAPAALSWGILVTVLLLVFPLTWLWEVIPLLLPCAAIVLAQRQVGRPPRWWLVWLGFSLLPLALHRSWLLGMAGWLLHQQAAGLAGLGVLLYGLPTYGLLLFTGAQLWLLWRAQSPAAPKEDSA
jgi:hypothetical protein